MSAAVRQYFFGALALAVAIYYFTRKDYIEMALYGLAGLSFIVNHLSMDSRLITYKKPLAILSWILIISTGLLFLYVIQFKYL